jgi:hypothetical protein
MAKISWQKTLILGVAVLLSVGGYLIVCYRTGYLGYPLDDAWIHQTYARNFAASLEWVYFPHQPSAGSTSPLWSSLLALGYWIAQGSGHFPQFFTYLLGGFCLFSLSILAEQIFSFQDDTINSMIPWAGLFVIGEWHLVWASISGMEILLLGTAVLSVFLLLLSPKINWGLTGLIIGITIWIRPDGITLLGPAFFIMFFNEWLKKKSIRPLLWLITGSAVPVILYLFFNRALSGNWLPNTFYAKQAEYATYQTLPLVTRFISLASQPMIGSGILLLPGVIYFFWTACRQRKWWRIAAILWWIGYTGLYTLRLPVTYQHGRYLMPAMPIFFLFGLVGVIQLVDAVGSAKKWQWILCRAWILSLVIVWGMFFILGANSYAKDVGTIETEMVKTAQWVSENTETDALVAAHDIGALGYFGKRQLVDLAGLVSPEVIPFIRDEQKLADYLEYRHVNYLVTFPGWYPYLTSLAEPIYQSNGQISIQIGGENMVVYRWLKR